MASNLDKLFEYIRSKEELYIQRLTDVVAIQSVSAWADKRGECIRMMEHTKTEMEKLGCDVKLMDIGTQDIGGESLPLPPIILGCLGKDPDKKTLCVYGHLDVQPACVEDGWDTEPFVLTEV
nr:cytosolic non-specific dipeptidase-like [Ciona intestinalis]|eukprot:XP_002124592.3 cytosolic non-specific dipeptidase-like [Ciona intestinalis]